MKSVSDRYWNSMREPLRNPSHVIIQFGNVDTTAPGDGAWADNGAMPWSSFETMDYAFQYTADPYATLELNRWLGDGSFDLAPVSGPYTNQGFCANQVAGADGALSVPLPMMTRAFSLEHTMPGLTLTFDSICGEWPRAITVRLYQGNTLAEEQKVTDISSLEVKVATTATKITKIEILFDEMLPYHRPRLTRVMFGRMVEFTDYDIISVRQSHDVDPLSRRLPKESFSFTIHDYEKRFDPDSPTGIWQYIDIKSPISIQFGYEIDEEGTVEWLHPDNYVLNGRPAGRNYEATFSGTGLIGSMDRLFYKGTFGRKSFYDLAEAVLLDAGLTKTELGENPWDIDDDLKTMYCNVPLPVDTHMNVLQLIAHACRSRFFTDEDNIIHIRPFGVSIRGIYTGTWEDNGAEAYSEWGSVDNDDELGAPYATLELNQWLGDGSFDLVPADGNYSLQGFVSSKISEPDGAFGTTPVVSRLFQVPHDLPIVKVLFDERNNEWPREVVIRYWRDGQVVQEKPVQDITGPELMIRSDVVECDNFDLLFTDMLPYRRPRIQSVRYQETDFMLDFNTILEDTQSSQKTDELRNLTVSSFSYVPDEKASVLFEGSTDRTFLHIDLDSPATDIQVSVTGGTVVKSEIFAEAVDLTLSAGTKAIRVTGVKQSQVSHARTWNVHQNGADDEIKNPLVSDEAMQEAMAEHYIAYLGYRSTYDADYRGNPELEVGDLIILQTNYTPEMDAIVLTDELSYDGSLHGKVKVKGLV